MLHEMLSGRLPFVAETREELQRQVLEDAPPPLPGVHPDLVAVRRCCLEKDPSRRYASAAHLADDLQAFLDGREVRARPLGLGGRGLRRAARHPVFAALALALFAVAVYGVATPVARLRREQRVDAEAVHSAANLAPQFDAVKRIVLEAAGDPAVVRAAAANGPSPEAIDVCNRNLREHRDAFVSWWILATDGKLIGRAPTEASDGTVGNTYPWRDYFVGAKKLADQKRHEAHISRAFRDERSKMFMIAIAVPLYDHGTWVGILASALSTGPTLGPIKLDRPRDAPFTVSLVAQMDRERKEDSTDTYPVPILDPALKPGTIRSPDTSQGWWVRTSVRVQPVPGTPFSVETRSLDPG
jgi:hypothetical protein